MGQVSQVRDEIIYELQMFGSVLLAPGLGLDRLSVQFNLFCSNEIIYLILYFSVSYKI